MDTAAAADAYAALHTLLRSTDQKGRQSYLAHATTNYDLAIEAALDADTTSELISGFASRRGDAASRFTPNLLTSVNDSTRLVPVLHLHGAVGWYEHSGDVVRRTPADETFDERRVPALLLPDEQKDPTAFGPPAAQIWGAFRHHLRNATHILVLGQSLHDAHIVNLLTADDVAAAITIVVHVSPTPAGDFDIATSPEIEHLQRTLPGATLIGGEFGPKRATAGLDRHAVQSWLRSDGPLRSQDA